MLLHWICSLSRVRGVAGCQLPCCLRRKTAQDSGNHTFMWNEARNINYCPPSTHTQTLPVCVRTYSITCAYANARMTRQHSCGWWHLCVFFAHSSPPSPSFCLHPLFHLRYAKMATIIASLNVTSICHVVCFYLSPWCPRKHKMHHQQPWKTVLKVSSNIALQSDIMIQKRVDNNQNSK